MIDLSNVPGVVTIQNLSANDVKLNISGYNQSFTLPAGETVKLKAETSSELVGFLSQAVDGVVEVTLPAAAEAATTSDSGAQ